MRNFEPGVALRVTYPLEAPHNLGPPVLLTPPRARASHVVEFWPIAIEAFAPQADADFDQLGAQRWWALVPL